MTWRNPLYFAPVVLLSIVMAGQIYKMSRQFRSTGPPVMISRFDIAYGECGFAAQRVGSVLSAGMRGFGIVGDENDVIVSKVVGNEWRLAVQLRHPGAAAFGEEARLIKTLIRCDASPWCQGRAPSNEYGPDSLAILARKKAGQQIDLPGCGITSTVFKPLGWELAKPPESRIDALALIALFIEGSALTYLVWRPKKRSGPAAK